MGIKIEVDKEACIGCGQCAAVCSENWDIVDNIAVPKNAEPKEIGCNQEAADACPVDAIKITE